MKRISKRALSVLIALMCSLAVYSSAFAESEGEVAQPVVKAEETAEPEAEEQSRKEVDPREFFEDLEIMEVDELTFKIVKFEAVAENAKINEPHFKAIVLFQNNSPYSIRTPATAIELSDKGFNSLAVHYVKLDSTLKPGESKWATVEFPSLIELTAGASMKGVKGATTDYLYGERVNDASEITKAGIYVFVNSKRVNAKVSDSSGYQYLPTKSLMEALGFKYTWTAKTSTFVAVKDNLKIENKVGTRNVKANGKIVKLDGQQSAFLNKVPSLSVNALPLISSDWVLNKGYHGKITIITVADQSLMKF
ncbi:stalk domain-containing protein [Cohnella cholangitidis]|nr:stalk domain-containing protein [Cohnella cholangitidis]